MVPIDKLSIKSDLYNGGIIAIPAIKLSMYFPGLISSHGKSVLEIIDKYLSSIRRGAITIKFDDSEIEENYPDDSGEIKRVSLDFEEIREELLPERLSEQEMFSLWLWGDSDTQPNGYGLTLVGSDHMEQDFPNWLNYISIDWPIDFVTSNLDDFLPRLESYVSSLNCQSAVCGIGYNVSPGLSQVIRADLDRRLLRYLALDPCYDALNFELGGSLPYPTWLTFIGDELLDSNLRHNLRTNYNPRELRGGMLIRSSMFPPLGDINRQAPDIGRLPSLARTLAPITVDQDVYGQGMSEKIVERWIERFTTLEDRQWDNSRYQRTD
ncbi:hypothetical protein CYK37_17765 [Mesorhizobium loti]|nr:type VI immunity family protein [Mesorhizobium loti]PLP58052.1 hypothetical protein CYK37_17765 [Mesorhizobium loti]